MSEKTYQPGEPYAYPLIIKKLLTQPLAVAPDHEIVYRDQWRYTYRDMAARVHRLANCLTGLGVKAGDTVAVMDWDSHRYLEAYFAVPMMGAVLQTVNWRLAGEQILYTLSHAEASVLFLHTDFLPIWDQLYDKAPGIRQVILIADGKPAPQTRFANAGEYEELL
jgi:fatty-acyl-CoA synthase